MQPSPIIAFMLGEQPDSQGRWISDIWQLSPFWREFKHDYIQWLFPLERRERYEGHKPILSLDDQAFAKTSLLLQENQRKSLDMMCQHWGLVRAGLAFSVVENLSKREHRWIKPYDHNQLRITRAIRSLALCGQKELALALQQAVLQIGPVYGNVDQKAIDHWQRALDDL
ncbi:hypothetical protein A4G20_02220 [Pasteurellaceae bacterium RH1A]|nr:hypothetical protein A4G20_02220 [Pasteurellaceae bacterium RH1A]